MSGGGDMERRAFCEVRTAGRRIEGYAAIFGSEAALGSFRERIAPGAFRGALAGDVLALAQCDDLGGMSFGFKVPKGGESWNGETRTLNAIDMKEISVVSSWPAYPDTEIALRSPCHDGTILRRRRSLILAEVARAIG